MKFGKLYMLRVILTATGLTENVNKCYDWPFRRYNECVRMLFEAPAIDRLLTYALWK